MQNPIPFDRKVVKILKGEFCKVKILDNNFLDVKFTLHFDSVFTKFFTKKIAITRIKWAHFTGFTIFYNYY